MDSIKELGLVLVSDLSAPQNDRHHQQDTLSTVANRVDGVFKDDGILEFRSGVDM